MYSFSLVTVLSVFALLTNNGAVATETITVTSSSIPYESRFVLKINDFATTLNGEYDYWSPVLKSPSEHGVEWQFNLKSEEGASRRQVYLQLHNLPHHISNALVSINCSLSDNENKWYNDVANKFLTEGKSVKFEFYHRNVHNVTLECHVKGSLRQNDVVVTGHGLDKIVPGDNKTMACTEAIREDTTREMATVESKRTDVTLRANRKKIKGHKTILGKRLKNYDLLPQAFFSSNSEIDFSGEMSGMELDGFVSFLYYGRMTFPKRTCAKLYAVAKKYGADCLEKFCEEKLSAQIDVNTAQKIFKYAELNKSDRLMEEATHCVTNPDSPKCVPLKSYHWW